MSVAVNARSTTKSADLHLVATPARRQTSPLPSASQLREALPLSAALARQVQQQRQSIRAILDGHDPRLLVVVGPCSLHDDAAVLEYAERLAALSQRVGDRLLLLMRAYVEKPRTTVGWKGLVYDPE
ncbi:MAG: 3-deoxy-7-phosphoheptulonate synthase, partial [Gammaproteobacteria bacterium]|nr:3-deoxy-7-phosphoheptulonate synthase [Gammaproteobacteria bacterium]